MNAWLPQASSFLPSHRFYFVTSFSSRPVLVGVLKASSQRGVARTLDRVFNNLLEIDSTHTLASVEPPSPFEPSRLRIVSIRWIITRQYALLTQAWRITTTLLYQRPNKTSPHPGCVALPAHKLNHAPRHLKHNVAMPGLDSLQ